LPFTAQKLRHQLNADALDKDILTWLNAGKSDLLTEGHTLGQSSLLFEKLEDDVINRQIQKLHDAKRMNELLAAGDPGSDLPAKEIPEPKNEITYDDFAKMDIRIGTITEAERIPKSDKLLKLRVDDGMGGRQILSGIAKHFTPEELIGKQVTFLANLAPRKMMGMESQGMILMAEDRDGTLALLPPGKPVWNGGTVN
jgi:methionyl-tRNA synthetase